MQFGLSEEQSLLQDTVLRFLRDQVSLDQVRAYADGGSDAEIWQGLAELGVPALLVPESHGGLGLTLLDAAIISEALGYHVCPGPFVSSAAMATTVLAAGGNPGDRLADIAAGTLRVGIAFGEAVGRRADGGVSVADGRLNGTALFAFDDAADADRKNVV